MIKTFGDEHKKQKLLCATCAHVFINNYQQLTSKHVSQPSPTISRYCIISVHFSIKAY